jgi:hypothetical protein
MWATFFGTPDTRSSAAGARKRPSRARFSCRRIRGHGRAGSTCRIPAGKRCARNSNIQTPLVMCRFKSIKVAMQIEPDYQLLTQARTRLLGIAREEKWSKETIAETIRIAVPELVHIEKNRSLDDKF